MRLPVLRPGGSPAGVRLTAATIGALALLVACSDDDDRAGTDASPPVAPATGAGDDDGRDLGERRDDEHTGAGPGDAADALPVRDYIIDPPERDRDLVRVVADDDAQGTGGVDSVGFVDVTADELTTGFSSQLKLLDRGVELGVWSRADGAIALLRILAGEAPRSTVDGLDHVTGHSSTPLIRLARNLVADDDTPDAGRAELERLLDALVPSEDFLDDVTAAARTVDTTTGDATTGDTTTGDDGSPTGFRRPATTDDDNDDNDNDDNDNDDVGGCINPHLGHHPEFEAFDAECWRSLTTTVASPTGGKSELTVMYSERHTEFAKPTLDALVRSVEVGHDWSDATTTTSLVIQPLRADTDDDADADTGDGTDDGTNDGTGDGTNGAITDGEPRTAAGIVGFATGILDRCFVTMVVDDDVVVSDAYRQVVAHEQTHCLQFESYRIRDDDIDREEDEWFIEGGAEYFSHVIYPTGRTEREHIGEFLDESLKQPLMAMDYPTWLWWQYLANRTSPTHVFELHGRMFDGDAVEVLAAEPGIAETFQDFAVDLMHRGIDTEADPVPASSIVLPHGLISEPDIRDESVERFVVARVGIHYAGEQRYEQTDLTAGDGRYDMVALSQRLDRGAWGPVPDEVRAECDDSVYLMALTTVTPDAHEVRWSVDDVTADECDRCLVGTWLLDNESFVDTMGAVLEQAAEHGGQMPPGVDFAWSFVGPYHLRLDDEGDAVSWREGWQMVLTGSVQGTTFEGITTIDSIETFEYRGDGERLEFDDIEVVDITVLSEHRSSTGVETTAVVTPDSATVSIFGQTTGLDTDTGVDDAPQGVTASYTCDAEMLRITFDETPGAPMRWNRAADPPDPPA